MILEVKFENKVEKHTFFAGLTIGVAKRMVREGNPQRANKLLRRYYEVYRPILAERNPAALTVPDVLAEDANSYLPEQLKYKPKRN